MSVSGNPEAGATLTASVSDPDGAVSGVGWVWSVGASPTGSFSAVSGATGAAFVVRAADVGKYLRAAATYTDVTHSASGQTASETVGPVGAANEAPVFASGSASRTVAENTASGNVGSPVTATDADSDALTYSVAESSGPDAAAVPAADLDAFNRDFEFDPAAAGQVRVKAGAAIDYEARSTYKVAYRVTDNKNAAGGSDPAVDDTLILTISVTNLNEAGSVSVSGDPEAGATLTASVSDPDGAVSGVGWVWSVGASPTGSFSAVSGATDAAFVVRAADVGKHLRAAATYTDVTHSASGQTAAETVGPVGATNSAPVFADSNNDGTADAVSRTVTENTTTGAMWGRRSPRPIADSGDVLAYSVAESSGHGRGGGPGRFQPGLLAGRGDGPDQRGGRRGDRLRDPQHLQGGLPGHRQQEQRQASNDHRDRRHAGVDDQRDQRERGAGVRSRQRVAHGHREHDDG